MKKMNIIEICGTKVYRSDSNSFGTSHKVRRFIFFLAMKMQNNTNLGLRTHIKPKISEEIFSE